MEKVTQALAIRPIHVGIHHKDLEMRLNDQYVIGYVCFNELHSGVILQHFQ